MFSKVRQCYQVMKDHSNIPKMPYWMIQRAKNEVFGHFQEFGLLDRLDIAYCDRTKCFPAFGNVTRPWRTIQKSHKSIFEWSKVQKKRFLAIFWSLVCWIDLILHIVIVLNVFQLSAMLPGHEGSFKYHKYPFLNDPKGQKWGFWPFSWVWSVGSTWYCIFWLNLMFLNIRQHYQVMTDHAKVTKMRFWMIQCA